MSEFENEKENELEEEIENAPEEPVAEEPGQDPEAAGEIVPAEADDEPVAPVEVESLSAEPPELSAAEIDEQLWDKTNKAARLLRNRRAALQKEQEERGGRPTLLVRALKLLQLKPKMTQKEMADLLGVKLHELDTVLADAERNDIISRVEPVEPDMRKIVVMADENSMGLAESYESKGERFVPGMSAEETKAMLGLLDKVIDKLTAMGLDDEREKSGDFKGRGERHDNRGERGNRGGFGGRRDDRNGRGGRGGFGGSRGGYRGGNRRDDRGGRRDDRGSFRSNRGNRH